MKLSHFFNMKLRDFFNQTFSNLKPQGGGRNTAQFSFSNLQFQLAVRYLVGRRRGQRRLMPTERVRGEREERRSEGRARPPHRWTPDNSRYPHHIFPCLIIVAVKLSVFNNYILPAISRVVSCPSPTPNY